jgi:hypothetical protein
MSTLFNGDFIAEPGTVANKVMLATAMAPRTFLSAGERILNAGV